MSSILNTETLKMNGKVNKKNRYKRNDTYMLHLLVLPAIVLLIIYHYVPMVGLVIAFQKFQISKGFFGSEWIGFQNFQAVMNAPECLRALVNTLSIASLKIITMTVVPIVVAVLLNEMKHNFTRRSVQTLIYLPHFLSWIILAGILKSILAGNGMINILLGQWFGLEPISFLGDKNLFQPLVVITNVWKEFGFSTIIYFAAILGIDPSYYEAAIMDGASRWKQTIHITIPGMMPIIVLCSVLSLGSVLNAGFDQIFNLYSVPVYETGDVIDTLVYRLGVEGGQFAVATAVGLFKSVVSLIMITISYVLAYKVANYEIF